MELVEGEDLAARLARGPLPVVEAVELARQVAEALEAAHEKGIIHSDLKPANVKWTADGQVKLLDFGLAKALDGEPAATTSTAMSISPTLNSPMTAAHVILGTAAYMSPEQARGKAVDRRADIWAFGCVLYECLTGAGSFPGETVSDTIAKILEREPDWTASSRGPEFTSCSPSMGRFPGGEAAGRKPGGGAKHCDRQRGGAGQRRGETFRPRATGAEAGRPRSVGAVHCRRGARFGSLAGNGIFSTCLLSS
jgi:serine/threonine protein kinase